MTQKMNSSERRWIDRREEARQRRRNRRAMWAIIGWTLFFVLGYATAVLWMSVVK